MVQAWHSRFAFGHVMDSNAYLQTQLQAMPPVAAMQFSVARYDGEQLTLQAPLAANINDKGCAFGGSQASLMTVACWGWLVLRLRESGLHAEVYVADSQLRYLAPLYQDLRAQARLAPEQHWPTIVRTLQERGRARAQMYASMLDERGQTVATMQARFALIVQSSSKDSVEVTPQ